MISPEQIYGATNGGLDIILSLYPQARDVVGKANGKFAIRNERTPSANLRLTESSRYGKIYMVTDFGGDGHAKNAIDLYMDAKGYDRHRFAEALLQLAAQYGVADELNRSVNKPRVEQRDARSDEKDGDRSWELNDHFTVEELAVMGPRVTQADVDALHWFSVKSISVVKNRRVTTRYSTPTYPIFIRQCVIREATADREEQSFFKIYEPLNPDKGFRFSYAPAGAKPKVYTNGLYELRKAYAEMNSAEEKEWLRTHDGEPYKEQKLPEAFICSGERDSLCCHSMGYHPLWFNSETYQVSKEEMAEIMKYVEVLYNIPDIDSTGRRKGTELALRFIDIRTIWLPDWLAEYKDNRGHARKDLRDYIELRREKSDFRNLMRVAMPAKFWEVHTTKSGSLRYEMNTAYLFNFFRLNGFYTLHDEDHDDPIYIQVTGNIVRRVTSRDLREFVRRWTEERFEDLNILNLVLNSPRLAGTALEAMKEVNLDFTDATRTTQLFFFPDKTVEVCQPSEACPTGFREFPIGDDAMHNFVWQENVIPHRVKLADDMFAITYHTDDAGQLQWDIDIKNVDSHFFGYLINSSRVHWRQEMEYRFGDDRKAMADYAAAHRFDIAGEGLTDEEIAAQKTNLISKIFAFGYMMHHYKDLSRTWAPMAMDNKIGENGECNGRSGKSFFFTTLAKLMKTVKLSGRNPKLMDNPHVFDQVTKHTQMMLVDDCDRYLNMGLFYDNITSDMTVNPKNNHSFTIPFEQSPKLAFTTNYVPAEFSPSTEARSLYLVFSDYYHQKTEDNDYLSSWSIRDDFDKTLYGPDYAPQEWTADISFFLQCLRFYLSLADKPIKIQPPMRNIVTRKLKADMGDNFEDWAYGYFSEEGENLNRELWRDEVFNDFCYTAHINKISMKSFVKKMKAFAEVCPWIEALNPRVLQDKSGRIQRKWKDPVRGDFKTKDVIYLQQVGTELYAEQDDRPSSPTQPAEQQLFLPADETDQAKPGQPF